MGTADDHGGYLGIWLPPGVLEEPEVVLIRWRVLEVLDRERRERHFVGYSVGGNSGRVSSAIVSFDPCRSYAVTKSGRVYQLVGAPGYDIDGEWVWHQWTRIKGFTEEKDVTDEYVVLLEEASRAVENASESSSPEAE
ncbi:hypothetical protein LPW11_09875 [Geomonas sp. RF6]|uniref:hypothetical protein n=1 Tax=Geomonas sp. RF6 TaxID=2897342 RepID=UPI001E626C1B|nr:hypothetical protein [Geomonas sp. RF6]UFS72482.1 hypothetical protein LPW11_09875 [Geomonas sp. RF6]